VPSARSSNNALQRAVLAAERARVLRARDYCRAGRALMRRRAVVERES
jgi:hypothetical protein